MKSFTLPTLPRLVIVLLLSLGFAHVAAAEDVATRTAMRHYDRGQKLFDLSKFDEALDEFEKAYDAKPVPDILFNIGQCHRNLGDYDAAIFSFKKFLKLVPEAPNRDKVLVLIDELEAKKEREGGDRFRFEKKPKIETRTPESHIYTKWWFWTGIAVVGAASGVGIYAATRPDGAPTTDLGLIVFGK